jgi:hypothetical protein
MGRRSSRIEPDDEWEYTAQDKEAQQQQVQCKRYCFISNVLCLLMNKLSWPLGASCNHAWKGKQRRKEKKERKEE